MAPVPEPQAHTDPPKGFVPPKLGPFQLGQPSGFSQPVEPTDGNPLGFMEPTFTKAALSALPTGFDPAKWTVPGFKKPINPVAPEVTQLYNSDPSWLHPNTTEGRKFPSTAKGRGGGAGGGGFRNAAGVNADVRGIKLVTIFVVVLAATLAL